MGRSGRRTCATARVRFGTVEAMTPCAFLRVYVPLEELRPHERARWQHYVDAGRGVGRRSAIALEARTARRSLIAGPGWPGDGGALVRRVGSQVHVCPLDLQLRAARAFAEFRTDVPAVAVDAFAPQPGMFRMLEEVRPSRRRPAHIIASSWVVPLVWFVLFDPDDRRLHNPPEGRGARLVYLTSAEAADIRLQRALDVVAATVDDEELLDDLADLGAWVEEWPGDSIVELDYGALTERFALEQLERDVTCEDVWEAIDRLEEGDAFGAAAAYGSARTRWTGLRALQHAS